LCLQIFGTLGGTSLPLISFSKIQTLRSLEGNIAPKSAIIQSSRKAVRSASQGSTIASAASGGVMIRSMTKATGEESIVAAPL